MSLALAIRKNSVSLAKTQNTYKQNVAAVNTLVTSVLASSLPTLNQNPPDWQDFVNAYEKANSDALNWVNDVMARLLDVPDEVRGYNNIISQLLQNAKTQADTLVSNPSDQSALDTLNQDLSSLSSQLNLITTFISGAVTSIRNFQDVLPDMATQLQSIATKSTQDAQADQQQIDKLNADIASLQSEIKSLTAAIIGLAIVDGVALTIGVVATIALWPVGAAVWFVLGPAIAVATTYIALDAEKIKADKAAIAADQQEITGLTADVSTLHILANNFAAMASQTEEIEANLQAVLQEWQNLESDVNAAITDIRTAISDAGSADYNAVVTDINNAITEWNETYAQAGDLHLDLQVNNAKLEIGMSSDQVKSAMAQADTIGIIEYYNNIRQTVAA